MKISLEWLKEFVDIKHVPSKIAEDLTMAGLEVEGFEEIDGDTIFELSVTPNRPDLLSHQGVAREISALYGLEITLPDFEVLEEGDPVEAMSSIDIEDPGGCPRYSGRVITGVRIGPSPEGVKKRLESLGVRSISNVVDATNYVMLELGQPLHAFDYHRLAENRIVVKRALSGETMKTLDGQQKIFDTNDLLICDGAGPVALAGIMGGLDSEVNSDSTDLLLESAHFDPTSIRRSAKRMGLSTEASYRFERGTDPSGTVRAVTRLAVLIHNWAGGTICRGVLDAHPKVEGERKVMFSMDSINDYLGTGIEEGEVVSILTGLGMDPSKGEDGQWAVRVPGYRRDIAIKEDIIEEVARIHGYQEIPATMPVGRTVPVVRTPGERILGRARNIVEGMGFSEAINYSFVSHDELKDLGLTGGPEPVRLLNPISEEMEVMRTSLLPGLLRSLRHNVSRRVEDVRLYEIGKVFLPSSSCEISEERLRISAVMTGVRSSKTWYRDGQVSDFFDIKGAAENLLSSLGIRKISFAEMETPYLQPGQSAWVMIGDGAAGPVGSLHPRILEKLDIRGWAGCFELDFPLIEEGAVGISMYEQIPRYPAVLRDLALVVPAEVPAGDIEGTVSATGKNLKEVRLFDLYQGKGIPEGFRSLAFSLSFQNPERTLTDEEVDASVKDVLKELKKKYGAKLR